MIQIGAQYYRPPFPVQKFWENDLKQMKDSGLDTVQLWLVWGWIESKKGTFKFDDYDKLIDIADKVGLSVVLSTSAELHPYWIHDAVPNSEMIDHVGNKVISGNRCENHFGLTPGGCFDHPKVWNYMKRFLEKTTLHYRNIPHLAGWDAWNELRWHINSNNLVCFCDHTISKWQDWLKKRFGTLANLNKIWMRRYNSWQEVLPGRVHDKTYTELMEWQYFRTQNCNEHARKRYDAIKALDPKHDVTVHGAIPCPLSGGGYPSHHEAQYALDRGNDWDLADHLDGIGCSSFPKWFGIDEAGFGTRIDYIKSAARGKKVWLSEIQGGRAAIGFNIYQEVDAPSQQRWIWTGIACGADKLLFWCWRDEVFGRESAGFGIVGSDGLTDDRIKGLQSTRKILDKHQAVFNAYKPQQKMDVGVLFSPQSYYMVFSQDGKATRSIQALQGYSRALTRNSIPFVLVEEEHLDSLKGLKILFLPRVLVFTEKLDKALREFVKNGGTLVCESESGAFTQTGFYHYPNERLIFDLTQAIEVGRRPTEPSITMKLNSKTEKLPAFQWLTPTQGGKPITYAKHRDGSLIAEYKVGKGKIIHLGSYFGEPYFNEWNEPFETMIEKFCADAGVLLPVVPLKPKKTKDKFLYVKCGEANGKKVIFLFLPEKCKKAEISLAPGFIKSNSMKELFTNKTITIKNQKGQAKLSVTTTDLRLAVLLEN